jgi:alpha-beta hydrolase superfamily lysophospholipase
LRKGNLDMPILFVSGEKDPLSNYGVQVKVLYELMKSLGYKNIEYKLYTNDRHEILNELDHDVVFNDLLAFINKKN